MDASQIGKRAWSYAGVLQDAGLSCFEYVEQLTLLLFLTFYIPCVSTFAVMVKTIGRRDALFSVSVSVGVALLVSGIVRLGLGWVQLFAN